jgi:predicted CxxxxCH...CXXCH cytochrome family protein
VKNMATAYVCTNFACHSPTTDVTEMLRLLDTQKD